MNNLTGTEVAQYRESLKLVNNALEKSNKTGSFALDESYVIKIALSNLEKAMNVIEEVYKNQEQPSANQEQSSEQPLGKTLKSALSK